MAEGVGGPAGVVGDLGLGPRGELQPEHGRPVSLLRQESRLRKILLYKYFFGKQYRIVQYSTIQYNIVQYIPVQHSRVQYSTVQ